MNGFFVHNSGVNHSSDMFQGIAQAPTAFQGVSDLPDDDFAPTQIGTAGYMDYGWFDTDTAYDAPFGYNLTRTAPLPPDIPLPPPILAATSTHCVTDMTPGLAGHDIYPSLLDPSKLKVWQRRAPSKKDLNPTEDLVLCDSDTKLRCRWGTCGCLVPAKDIWNHIKDSEMHQDECFHDGSPSSTRVKCRWEGCNVEAQICNMKKHIDGKHTNSINYQCVYCGWRNRYCFYLRRHGLARDCPKKWEVLSLLSSSSSSSSSSPSSSSGSPPANRHSHGYAPYSVPTGSTSPPSSSKRSRSEASGSIFRRRDRQSTHTSTSTTSQSTYAPLETYAASLASSFSSPSAPSLSSASMSSAMSRISVGSPDPLFISTPPLFPPEALSNSAAAAALSPLPVEQPVLLSAAGMPSSVHGSADASFESMCDPVVPAVSELVPTESESSVPFFESFDAAMSWLDSLVEST